MRIFIWKLKEFLRTGFAVLVVLLCVGVLLLANISRFPMLTGERIFYLNSASSQGLRSETVEFSNLLSIRGESIRLTVVDEEQGKVAARQIFKMFNAEILSVEHACGVTSYYGYTSNFANGVYVNGQKVNLHVAVCGTRLVVGAPIIFDGF